MIISCDPEPLLFLDLPGAYTELECAPLLCHAGLLDDFPAPPISLDLGADKSTPLGPLPPCAETTANVLVSKLPIHCLLKGQVADIRE